MGRTALRALLPADTTMNDKEFFAGFKLWIPALFIIACILLFSIAGRTVLVRNAGEAFNRQQLALAHHLMVPTRGLGHEIFLDCSDNCA